MTDWRDNASCLETGGHVFFPSQGDDSFTPAAKAICNGCPVKAACLEFALDNNIDDGVWGGTSPKERAKLRRGRPRPCGMCGQPLTPGRGNTARYCPGCKQEARRRSQTRYNTRRTQLGRQEAA